MEPKDFSAGNVASSTEAETTAPTSSSISQVPPATPSSASLLNNPSISNDGNNTSGLGNLSIVPDGVKGWSWGAFGFSWLWGIFNNTLIALLTFIPFVGLIMIFVLGAKGREWAWKNKHWESLEQFNKVQRTWSKVWIILFAVLVVISASVILMANILMNWEFCCQTSNSVENDSEAVMNEVSGNISNSQEYEAYMSNSFTGWEDDYDLVNSPTKVGPAVIAFNDFFGLAVAMPYSSFLADKDEAAWVDVTSAVNKGGRDIIDHESSLEKDIFFKKLRLTQKSDTKDYLYDRRTLHLISGSQMSDVVKVAGILNFKIPIGSDDSQNFYEKSFPFTLDVQK